MASKENKGLGQWLNTHAENSGDAEMLKAIWGATGHYKSASQFDEGKGFAKFQEKMGLEDKAPTGKGKTVQLNKANLFLRIAASAAILLVSVFLIKQFILRKDKLQDVYAEAGTKASIKLEDGSSVTLNEKSLLRYPDGFDADERRVYLKGEAFFEVAKNEFSPFVVETAIAQVRVVGTSFNVKSIGDALVEVYVKSGRVAVRIDGIGSETELNPGDKLVFDKSDGILEVQKDVGANSIVWNTGTLQFNEIPFQQIFTAVEQKFGVSIKVQNPKIMECKMTTTVKLGKNGLQESLKAWEIACPMKIMETGPGKFLVTGKCCE